MNLGLGGMSASRGQADEEVFGSAYDQRVILRLLPYVRPFMKLVVVSGVSMFIYTLTLVAVPWLIAWGIDDFIRTGDWDGLRWVFLLFLGVCFVNWGTNYLQQQSMQKVGQGVLWRLRRALFGHVQKQSMRYFDRTEVGRLMSRVQGDVGQLQEFAALVVMSLGELLSIVGIVIALLLLNLKLGLITMAVLPILIVIMVVWQRYANLAFIQVRMRII